MMKTISISNSLILYLKEEKELVMRSRELVDTITAKCNQTRQNKKDKLLYIGVLAPFGYIFDKNNKQLIIDKKSSFVIYLIFNLYDKGYGFTYIADYLNIRDIVCPSTYKKTNEYINNSIKDSNLWNKSSVRKIINNKVYNGFYKYSLVKTHKAIINDSLWSRVQDRLNNLKTRTGNDFYEINNNEFCGKVCCNLCHQPFTMETSICKDGPVKYLRCSSYDRRGNHKYTCTNKLAIKYDELRDIVNVFIKKELFDNKIDLSIIQDNYAFKLKDNDIIEHRKYLKLEKNVILKLIVIYQELLDNLKVSKNQIYKIKNDDYNKYIVNLNNRVNEIDNMLKEINGFSRTTLISNKELYMDKLLIDTFIEKVKIGELFDNKRKIEIILK